MVIYFLRKAEGSISGGPKVSGHPVFIFEFDIYYIFIFEFNIYYIFIFEFYIYYIFVFEFDIYI